MGDIHELCGEPSHCACLMQVGGRMWELFFLFFFGFLAKVEKNQVIIVCCVRPVSFIMLA